MKDAVPLDMGIANGGRLRRLGTTSSELHMVGPSAGASIFGSRRHRPFQRHESLLPLRDSKQSANEAATASFHERNGGPGAHSVMQQ